jgi:glycine cleavage system H protein
MPQLRGCDFPDELLYHADSHLWFRPTGPERFRVGVTQFGIALSGEILLFTPKPLGAELDAGRGFGLLEAGKTVFPVKTPFDARLLDANPALDPSARAMNRQPFEAWLVELQALAPLPPDLLLPWDDARPEIEKIMDRYAFRDLADFSAPLFHEDDRDF